MRFPAARIFAALFFIPSVLVPDSLLPACRADSPSVQDVFVGSGSPGPFALSWNNVQFNSETIAVSQQPQLRGLDYTLDAAAGTVTFTRPLPAGAAVEVGYATLPGMSQRTGSGQTIPLSVDLLRDQHGYFSLDALGTAAGNASALTLGADLGWHGGANNLLASRFVYTPIAASASGTAADRMGISLSGTAAAGQWGLFSAGFSRAGAGADTGSDGSFQSGREIVTLSSTLTPIKAVQAELSFSRSDPTDSTASAASTRLALDLTATPTGTTKMQASLAQTSAGPGGTAQTTAVSIDTQAVKMMDVSAAFSSQNLPGTASDSQTISLKTVLTPSKTYSLQTSADQSRLGAAITDQQSVTLALSPKPTMQLNAGFSLRQKFADGAADPVQTSEATVGGSLHPLPMLALSGSYKSRLAPASDTNPSNLFDTSAAQIAFTPFQTVKLTGTYAQNPQGDGTDSVQRLAKRGVGLETRFGALGLSGGCDWSRTYDTPDVEQTLHAALGLQFSKATQLSFGYQTQQNRLDASVPLATAYTVGFTHTLGDRFSLSVSGKRQQAATAASPDYNASASLGLKF